MPVEQRRPAVNNVPRTLIVGDRMIKTSVILQDLRRKIYLKEKDEKTASAGTGEGEVGFTNFWDYIMTIGSSIIGWFESAVGPIGHINLR
mgnify:CR=1 FL=1